MKMLSDKELEWVKSLDGVQQARLDTSIHEAGHAIIALNTKSYFTKIVLYDKDPDAQGGLEGLVLPDGWTKRQSISICLGGWAANEIFCGIPINIKDHNSFKADLNDIKYELTTQDFEAILREVQPQTKKIMAYYQKALVKIGFALFEKGTLTYEECKALMN